MKLQNVQEIKVRSNKYDVSYTAVAFMVYAHLAALYGIYMCLAAKWMTLLFTYATCFMGTLGITVGVHRLWSHKAFKASRPLEVFLMLCHSLTFQYSAYKWVTIHRLHHRFSDTESDPHDSSRGLFYSHIGWIMIRRPGGAWPSDTDKLMEDIRKNPILDFQRRHSPWLLPTLAFLLPTIVPLLWGESLTTAWHLSWLRFVINYNQGALINSIAHVWGYRPYDTRLKAAQTWLLVFLTLGEGHHNFHHAFPYDYRSCEKGQRWTNVSSLFIDVCAKLGLAYNLRVAGEVAIETKKEKWGDGSNFGHSLKSL